MLSGAASGSFFGGRPTQRHLFICGAGHGKSCTLSVGLLLSLKCHGNLKVFYVSITQLSSKHRGLYPF